MKTELLTFQLLIGDQSYYLNKDIHKGYDNNKYSQNLQKD